MLKIGEIYSAVSIPTLTVLNIDSLENYKQQQMPSSFWKHCINSNRDVWLS